MNLTHDVCTRNENKWTKTTKKQRNPNSHFDHFNCVYMYASLYDIHSDLVCCAPIVGKPTKYQIAIPIQLFPQNISIQREKKRKHTFFSLLWTRIRFIRSSFCLFYGIPMSFYNSKWLRIIKTCTCTVLITAVVDIHGFSSDAHSALLISYLNPLNIRKPCHEFVVWIFLFFLCVFCFFRFF